MINIKKKTVLFLGKRPFSFLFFFFVKDFIYKIFSKIVLKIKFPPPLFQKRINYTKIIRKLYKNYTKIIRKNYTKLYEIIQKLYKKNHNKLYEIIRNYTKIIRNYTKIAQIISI